MELAESCVEAGFGSGFGGEVNIIDNCEYCGAIKIQTKSVEIDLLNHVDWIGCDLSDECQAIQKARKEQESNE